MFNCHIDPRPACLIGNESFIHIFFCAMVPIDSWHRGKTPLRKDHYVPLVNSDMFQRQSRASHNIIGRSKTVPLAPKASPLPSTSTFLHSDSLGLHSYSTDSISEHNRKRQLLISNFVYKKSRGNDFLDKGCELQSGITPLTPAKLDSSSVTFSATTVSSSDTETVTPFVTSLANGCQKNDIGMIMKTLPSLSDAEKHNLLCNIWKPEPSYHFPISPSHRKFQHSWLSRFPWLAYSKALDGAFCVDCVFFGENTVTILQSLFICFTHL